jgi:hypothetical protein
MSAKWEEYVEHSASPDENDHLFFLDTGSRACRPPSFDTTIIGSSNLHTSDVREMVEGVIREEGNSELNDLFF